MEDLEEREEEGVGCLLCLATPLRLGGAAGCFLGEAWEGDDMVEDDEAVLVEDDLTGGGLLEPCWEGVRCLEGLAASRGSLEAFMWRCGRVPDAGGLALEGRGRREGGVCASLLDPERDAGDWKVVSKGTVDVP